MVGIYVLFVAGGFAFIFLGLDQGSKTFGNAALIPTYMMGFAVHRVREATKRQRVFNDVCATVVAIVTCVGANFTFSIV